MGIVLLYSLAAFLETGIGIWMFSQVFPKREKMEKRHRFSEWIVFFWITLCAYTFPAFFWKIKNEKLYIRNLILIHVAVVSIYIICKISIKRLKATESDIIKILLFTGMVICMGCQFWNSYHSYPMAIVGNIWPVFFLWAFYKCSFIQAYLWQFFYCTNLGMLKNVYITYSGVVNNRTFRDFFSFPRNHTYEETFYLLGIYVILIVLNRYIPLKNVVAKMLAEYKKELFLFTVIEWEILQKIVVNGLGNIETNNLAASLIIAGILVFCMMILYIRAIIKTTETEKNLLDVRNEIVERQYKEMKGAYEKYRCVVHDEKHMLLYLRECLENRDIEHAKSMIESYQTGLNEIGRCKWTGIQILDFILSIKRKQLESLLIKLDLDCQIDTIPVEDADFIVMFSNLLDNAIEATTQCQPEKRKIKIILKNVNFMFFMKIVNTFRNQPKIKNQRFITSKEDKKGHGWGIESVKHIVKKNNGEIFFDCSKEYFEVFVSINIENN